MLTITTAVFFLGFSTAVEAGPKRPLTFVVDTRLSQGPAENFTELYIDPIKIADMLSPLDSAEKLQPRALVSEDQITINDRIFFAPGSSEIRPSSFPILNKVAEVLRLRSDIEEVSIQGHTAHDEDGDLNLAMSVRRSKSVVDYLVKKGVDRSRISSVGFGGTRTAEGQDDNRVEFVIEKWAQNRMVNEVMTDHDTSKTTEKGSLLIENNHSYTAEVAVNGTRIGTVGPYTDAAIHGLSGGLYDVRFTHTSGYSYFEAVRTSKIDRPIVPGGKGAAVVLPNNGLPANISPE